jgi:hypothetical protein
VSSITIISDAPNCGVTYDRHFDNRNSFIIQATGVINWCQWRKSQGNVVTAKVNKIFIFSVKKMQFIETPKKRERKLSKSFVDGKIKNFLFPKIFAIFLKNNLFLSGNRT